MEKSRNYHEFVKLDPRSSSDTEGDVEDPDDSLQARVQREHMLELYSGDHPALKLAYEDWERTSSLLRRRVKRGTEVAGMARSEIYHLAGVFVVVEGVLLTTVSQAQLLTCENWWICFYLSFLASVVILIPLVQQITTYWSVHARIGSLLLALEVLSRRIHVMKTLGPLECTFEEKADDLAMHEVLLKKPGLSSTILRIAVITTTILTLVLLLMLGIQVRCEGSMKMPQRLQTFLKFSPIALTP